MKGGGGMLLSLYTSLQSRFASAWERVRDERGAAGVEYGILVAAIAAVIVVVAFAIGVKIFNAFTTVNNQLP